MLRFVLSAWGLAAGWAWLLFAQKGHVASLVGGTILGLVTLGLFAFMVRRSNRLTSNHEHVNARLEYHSGFTRGRWRRNRPARDDDGGSELTLGRGL